jgi:hypothetical protein
VNRQDSNRPLSLWLALLVLPILALAIYLQVNKISPQISPKKDSAEAILENPIATAAHPESVVSREAKPRVVDTPSKSPLLTPAEPVGLDPDSARVAVHKVENGVYERATQMFEREPVDVAWAGAHEQALRDMFSQHQGLQRVSVNSISCHTSMCRIEVFTSRDADADFFTAMFYDGLANFRDGALKADAAIARRMELGMTSVYVARKDHTLGFY